MKALKSIFHQSLSSEFEQATFKNDKPAMVGLIYLIVLILSILSGIVMYFYDMKSYLSLFLVGFVCFLGWLLNRAGHYRISAVILVVSLLIGIQYNIFAGFGIHDVAIIAWPAFIFFTGMLFGWRVIPYITALIMVLAVVAKLTPNGEFLSDYYSDTGDLIVMLFILAAFSLIAMSLLRGNELSNQALRESEDRYRHLYEASTVGLYRTTPDGRFLLANPTMVKMMGFSSFEEFSARNLENEGFAPDYARAHFLALIERDGKVKGLETTWTRGDGTTIYVRESAGATRDDQGKILFFDGIVEDITEQKHIEDARIVAEANFRAIFEKATVGIFQSTPQGRFQRVNPAMADIYGYDSPEDMLANITHIGSQIYVDPASRDDFQGKLAETGEVVEFFGENYRKDGTIIWTVTNARAVKDSEGQILYYEGFISDITDRKLAEEQIRRLNAELEQRVHERTIQLTAANQELEAFSYSVSHDLRAPLRSLEGFSSVLLEDYAAQLDEQGKAHLSRIQEASRRMGQLINDLLNLSRITRADFTRQQVDLSRIARQITGEFSAQFPQRQVQFDITANMIVQGDANLLHIVLENLLNNAFKFTSQREQALIQVGTIEQNGDRVYYVRDNGAGFNMEYANKLFGAFQRLHSAQEFPGIGIGLATVQRIIHRHGGRVWAEGEVDKGAAFYFTIP